MQENDVAFSTGRIRFGGLRESEISYKSSEDVVHNVRPDFTDVCITLRDNGGAATTLRLTMNFVQLLEVRVAERIDGTVDEW